MYSVYMAPWHITVIGNKKRELKSEFKLQTVINNYCNLNSIIELFLTIGELFKNAN